MGEYYFSYKNVFTILIFFVGFVNAGNIKLFELGTGQSYQLISTVTLDESGQRKGKDVGYQIQCDVNVGVVWENESEKNEKLLEIQLNAPKLYVKSSKSQTPNGFYERKSEIEKVKNSPFLVHWKSGKIINIYLNKNEERYSANLKKGIASSFQVIDTEIKETDVSGNCQVTYKSIDPYTFSKTKTNCISPKELPYRSNPDPVLTVNVTSLRTSTYKLTSDLSSIESVSTFEYHELNMIIKNDAGGSVAMTQHITLTDKKFRLSDLKSSNVEDAVKEFEKIKKFALIKQDLQLEVVSATCNKEDCPSLPKVLKENREYLLASSLGTLKSANAFVKLLWAARKSTKDELTKIFKGNKNKEILEQLSDLAGAIQLPESHASIMKIINFDSDEDLEKSERYLWSLAVGSHPHPSIIKDIFKISQRPHHNEKLSETLILTLAAMAHRFSKIPGNEKNPILKDITQSILRELEVCKDENCKIKYLRALKNLKCPRTIPVLVESSLNGNKKTSVEAIKALRSFDPIYWTEDVIDAAQKIYFEAGKKYDSSARTLALDILLESNPRREILAELLLSLVQYNPVYEVKQYLAQRVRQISDLNEDFSKLVNSIKKEFYYAFNNYDVQALRGLTTTFDRNFTTSMYRNGTLSVALEISKGVLKRGIFNVEISSSGKKTSLFTLGLFARGLSSFVSSDDGEEPNETNNEEEAATAGMELSILGTEIRPFVFFNDNTELMGHVWSGTASEKTTAFQALISVVDHLEYIGLQNGFLVQMQVIGGVSFDLSGQIQISLWNRNAHSLVDNSAGISLQGQIMIDASFIRTKVEFNVTTEVNLNLQSDINFYSGTALCMQLMQPPAVIKHNVHKTERTAEGHNLRKSRYIQIVEPGRSYALNRKNNEMCNLIFNE